jgi:hypothetical protein
MDNKKITSLQKKDKFKTPKKVTEPLKFLLNPCKFMRMNSLHFLDNIKTKFQKFSKKIS